MTPHRLSPARLVAGALALLLLAIMPAGCVEAQEDPSAIITEESVYNRLYFLASDGLRGRDTPSPGLDAAAAWLVSEHRQMGLEPAGEDGTFYQRWPYRQTAPGEGAVTLRGSAGSVNLTQGENAAIRGAVDGTLGAEIVVVSDPSAGLDEGQLSGQVALFRHTGEPSQPWRQGLNQLRNLADRAGAVVALVVVDDAAGEELGNLAQTFSNPTWSMGWDDPQAQIVVTESTARGAIPETMELLDGTGVETVADARLEGTLPAEVLVDGRPANVVAMIRGSDPELADEYVVLSAHYDHVGVGQPMDGDSIYNGADDNGSGTVALLETARAISQMDEAPRRSVLFVHVSGEEKGLLGSSWFVDHPTVPEGSMIANINADMVGGDHHRDSLIVIGKTYSDLGPLVDEVNDGLDLGLVTSDDLWPEQRFFFRSDQFHFMRKEIPSLFFFTGVHECYHRPCDTVDFVSHDKIARVARLLTHSVLEIANRDARPEWDPAGLAEVRELVGSR
jgi:hypothetical protein